MCPLPTFSRPWWPSHPNWRPQPPSRPLRSLSMLKKMPQIKPTTSWIFSEQSYWKVDYPLSAVTDLQAINVSVIFYFYFWGVGGILFQKLFEWQVAVLLQKCNSKLSTTSSSDLENRFYFGHLVSSLKFPTDRLLGWPWSDQHQQLKQLRKKKNGF